MNKIIPILFALSSITSCSKNGSSEKDNQHPVITITSPTNNQAFTGGQTVSIAGTVTDNLNLAELHVHISNNTTAQLLMDIHRYPGTGNYILSESFQVQAGINYKIQVIATDKSGNQQNTSVLISSH